MTVPIHPQGVKVDRSLEDQTTKHVNAELSKPWEADEAKRRIQIPDPNKKTEGIICHLIEQYKAVGWLASKYVESGRDVCRCAIDFYRPMRAKSDISAEPMPKPCVANARPRVDAQTQFDAERERLIERLDEYRARFLNDPSTRLLIARAADEIAYLSSELKVSSARVAEMEQ